MLYITGEKPLVNILEHYRHTYNEDKKQLIINWIKLNEFKMTAEEKQKRNKVLIFSDNTCTLLTWRDWGHLMIEVWEPERVNEEFSYLDYYM